MKFWLTAFGAMMLFCPVSARAADATSFDPLTVSVEALAISGVPVGTIIAWPVANNPEGWAEGNWLECNGQTISQAVYPELFAVMGGQVPDLRERMPQGSATAGNYRDAGLPNITGEFSYNTATPAIDNNNPYYTGCITAGTRRGNRIYLSSGIGGWAAKIDASRSSAIYGRSLTVQPAAYTVRYLIRAR